MKKLSLLLATLLIGGMMLSGCQKDTPNNGGNQGGDTPATEKVYSVKYELLETAVVENVTVNVIPGCKFDVSYVDADGKTVEVKQVTAPWSVTVENVKQPFTAEMKGKVSFDESQIPDTDVTFVKLPKISFIGTGAPSPTDSFKVYKFGTKQQFLNRVQEKPSLLEYSVTKSL